MTRNFSVTRISLSLLLVCICWLSPGAMSLLAQQEAEASSEGGIPTDEASISNGQSLFKANCASCHRVHTKLVGPALANVYERVPSLDWIVNFVWNSQKVIQSGDEYANQLWEEYAPTQMTAFPTFEKEQILDIVSYIKSETEKGPKELVSVSSVPGGAGAQGGSGVPSEYLNAILIGLIFVLVLILLVLGLIIVVLKKFLTDKDGLDEDDMEVVEGGAGLEGILKSKPFIFLVIFLFAAIAFKSVIGGLYSVGIQQGYAPTQPIAFSHKIHAGQYQIDCNYCHTGVRKSKSANIPSPNICMNCHSAVKTESAEIQKIYAAIENNKPIEWVRVHNLPDLAYFNHSQHVEVGGIECQTCHGPIEEMEVVRQHSLLTMGWCIDCHRKTNVNTKGNAYYDNLVELHEESSKEALKVEDIGGLECSKCHY